MEALSRRSVLVEPPSPPKSRLATTAAPHDIYAPRDSEPHEPHFVRPPQPARQADPESARGTLYLIDPAQHGEATILRRNGETSADGDDVPGNAVKKNRVILMTEGIGDDIKDYALMMNHLMQSDEHDYDINAGQPMLAVHEGTSAKGRQDVARIVRDLRLIKRLERHKPVDPEHAFATDPAVRTLYNVIKQQLDQHRDLLLVPHSGGGPENCLALHLLAQAGYRDPIHEHVRVLSLAGVVTERDFEQAGVAPGNVYYTADHRDAIGGLGAIYLNPRRPASLAKAAAELLRNSRQHPTHHNNDDNFQDNTHNGHNQILDFIQGEPGGTYIW